MRHATDTLYPQLDYYNYRRANDTWDISPSVIDFHDVSYIVDGEGIYEIDGKELVVRGGDLLYLPPQTMRRAHIEKGGKMDLFAMNLLIFDSRDMQPTSLPFSTVTSIGIRPDIIALYKDLFNVWMRHDEGHRLITRGYVELILGKLFDITVFNNPISQADLRIQQVVAYITEHYSQQVTLHDLADMIHLSPVYLSTLFHENMGVTLKKYINTIRINHAESMLTNNECNVTEAAEACGFCDVFYFSRVFTEIKGYNPREIILRKRR